MNRNYIQFPVQTHLELFLQMSETGFYSSEDIAMCNKAYYLALNCVYRIARGSGKPFICHLVGTASILVGHKAKVDVVIAGLMHALYQNRVDFPNSKSIDDRYQLVERNFNQNIAQLIKEYTDFENIPLTELPLVDKNMDNFQEVLMMRLADELEDITCYSLFMHGCEADNEEVKGSYLWRRQNKTIHIESILSLLNDFGMTDMKEAFYYWIHSEPSKKWSNDLKSGKYSSYQID